MLLFSYFFVFVLRPIFLCLFVRVFATASLKYCCALSSSLSLAHQRVNPRGEARSRVVVVVYFVLLLPLLLLLRECPACTRINPRKPRLTAWFRGSPGKHVNNRERFLELKRYRAIERSKHSFEAVVVGVNFTQFSPLDCSHRAELR